MKAFSNGIDQKNIVSKFGPSRLYAFLNVGILLIVSLVTMILAMKFFPLIIIISFICASIAWYKYLSILFTQYTLTKQTLTVRTGIIARTFNNLELYRVKDYKIYQSAVERVFGLMTVSLMTTDKSNPEILLKGVPLSDITETIRDLVQKARVANNIYEIN